MGNEFRSLAASIRSEIETLVSDLTALHSQFVRSLQMLTLASTLAEPMKSLSSLDREIDESVSASADAIKSKVSLSIQRLSNLTYKLARFIDLSQDYKLEHKELLESIWDTLQSDLILSMITKYLNDGKSYRSHYREMLFSRASGEKPTVASESYTLDSLGRKWSTGRFIEVEISKLCYGVCNSIVVSFAMALGEKTLVVDRPGHKTDLTEFAPAEFGNIMDKIFHPGSKSLVSQC